MNVPAAWREKVCKAWLSVKDRRIVAERVQTVTHEGVAVERISYWFNLTYIQKNSDNLAQTNLDVFTVNPQILF